MEKSKAAGVERELELAETVEAPVEAGQPLGSLRISSGGQVLAELPLLAATAVPRLSFGQIWLRLLAALAG